MSERNRIGGLSLGLRHIRRQLSTQPAVVTTLFVAVLTSVFLLAVSPRLLEEVSREDLEVTVSEPHPSNRNITIERTTRFAPGSEEDPLIRIDTYGQGFVERNMPQSVKDIVDDEYFLYESPQYTVTPLPGEDPPHPFPTFLRFTYQERIEDETQLLRGRMPTVQEPIPMLVGSACPSDVDVRDELFELLTESEEPLTDPDGNPVDCAIGEVNHYQVAVSEATARDMGLDIGQKMVLMPDATDSLYFGLAADELNYQLVFSISGIVEFSDVEREYWFANPDLHQPRIQENADLRIIFATGLMTPDAYADLFRDVGLATIRYSYRQFVSPEFVGEANLDTLISDLRDFESQFTPIVALPNEPRVITQLSDLLDDHVAQRTETVSVMSTTVASLFTVAVAVVLLLAVLMTGRQQSSLIYARNRGASTSQMTLTRVYEALVLVVPPAVLGYLVAELILSDTEYLMSYRFAVAAASVSVVFIVGAAWHLMSAPLGDLQREQIYRRGPSTYRTVAEVFVYVMAAGTVVLLRRRGEIESTSETITFDWLLAAAPTLISLAVALVAIRVFPLWLRVSGWIGSQLRGIVGFLGFRRLLSRSAGGFMPVAVMLICVSVAVFASVGRTTVDHGQDVSSYQAVGADFRLNGLGTYLNIPAAVDLSDVDEIEETAAGTKFARARLVVNTVAAPTEVLALEAGEYEKVIAGTTSDVTLPDFLTGLPQPGEGTEEQPIPAIVASDWPTIFQPEVGDIVTIDLGRLKPVIEVRELRDRFPDLPEGRPFVVFNRDALEAFSELPVADTVLYLKAPESASESIAATLDEQTQGADLDSRFEIIEAFSEDPFVAWVSQGYNTVFLFAGALAVVAAISSLLIASARRRVDFAYLKTMGLDTGQATSLTILEQIPGVLIAIIVGALSGVGIALALENAIGFDAFTGSLVPTSVTIDWLSIVAVGVVLFVALSLAIVMFVLLNRRQDLGQTLRVGDE